MALRQCSNNRRRRDTECESGWGYLFGHRWRVVRTARGSRGCQPRSALEDVASVIDISSAWRRRHAWRSAGPISAGRRRCRWQMAVLAKLRVQWPICFGMKPIACLPNPVSRGEKADASIHAVSGLGWIDDGSAERDPRKSGRYSH